MSKIAQFLQDVHGKAVRGSLFRGHGDATWDLTPSIGRHRKGDWKIGALGREKESFEEFKRKALPHLPSLLEKDIEWLCLMQHYGCPTRLLDFTTNPLIALFFASDPTIAEDGEVLITTDQTPHLENEVDNLFEHSRPFVYVPRHITSRIIGQSSCFLYSPTPNADISKELGRILISKNSKVLIRRELNQLDINYSKLFPGLGGLCSDLKDNLVSSLRTDLCCVMVGQTTGRFHGELLNNALPT